MQGAVEDARLACHARMPATAHHAQHAQGGTACNAAQQAQQAQRTCSSPSAAWSHRATAGRSESCAGCAAGQRQEWKQSHKTSERVRRHSGRQLEACCSESCTRCGTLNEEACCGGEYRVGGIRCKHRNSGPAPGHVDETTGTHLCGLAQPCAGLHGRQPWIACRAWQAEHGSVCEPSLTCMGQSGLLRSQPEAVGIAQRCRHMCFKRYRHVLAGT